jgi:hypothetical protein
VYDRILTADASSKPLRASLHRSGSTAATISERPALGLGTDVRAGRSADYGLGGSGAQVRRRFSNTRFADFPFKEVSSAETSRSDNVFGLDVAIPSSRADLRRTIRLQRGLSPEGNFPIEVCLFTNRVNTQNRTIRYRLYSQVFTRRFVSWLARR